MLAARALLLLAALPSLGANPAADFFAALAGAAALPLLPPHTPSFTVALEHVRLTGANGAYALPVHVIRDAAAGGVVVATYYERDSFLYQANASRGLGELQLLAPLPALAPLALPRLERVGWAWLYGAKVTTVTWLDCCAVTGDSAGVSLAAAPDGASVLLSQWQAWVPSGGHPNRTAQSVHNFTLRWDARYGYSVDAELYLRINAASAPPRVEFLNFLTPHLVNPWPDAQLFPWGVPPSGAPLPPGVGPWPSARPAVTAWANDSAGAAWTGFADNVLAGAELGTYPMAPRQGATVMVTPGAYAPALSFGALPSAGLNFSQMTCPTWADQHQVVSLPPPAADGFVTASPAFSLRWVPPAVSAHVLARLTLLHSPPAAHAVPPRWLASNMLDVGAVTDFAAQPVPLTRAHRALVQPHYASDYGVVHGGAGVGVNGSSAAWRVGARATAAAQGDAYAFANAQPLVPLNASAPYTFSAWARLSAGNGSSSSSGSAAAPTAHLWLGLWEADDFNQGIAPGPSYGRLAYMNSSVLTAQGGGGLRGAPALWVSGAVQAGLQPALRQARGDGGAAAAAAGNGWALLSIAFVSPAFPTYADLRAVVLGDDSSSGAFFDQWALLQG